MHSACNLEQSQGLVTTAQKLWFSLSASPTPNAACEIQSIVLFERLWRSPPQHHLMHTFACRQDPAPCGAPPCSLSGPCATGCGTSPTKLGMHVGWHSQNRRKDELGLPRRGCCLVLGFMYKEKYRRMTEGKTCFDVKRK
ncbi:Kin of IRRE-like protein 3 [Chelonia mydas]|uniref:Kin of IRRE-like protein 3 n=1 Tax=Chelonia mydas TaxID=8469 RepID=M7AVU2_CHEMY|nr:Kin of IRRE-like protein 3 [Chelonia mydas]